MQEALLLAGFLCGAVYLVMHLRARRLQRRLADVQESEGRFRGLTELSADWFWETDAEHRITWIAGGAPVATFFGATPAYGKRFWEIPRVEVEPRALASLLEGLQRRLPFFDLEIARADERGARQIHIISGQCRRDAHGNFLGYRGVGRDVTEQRRAERALEQAKERLELAMGGGNLAEWDYDLEADNVYLGVGWAAFLGRAPLASVQRGADLRALVHREDRPGLIRAFFAALRGEEPALNAELRMRAEAGEWRWLHASGRITERDARGRATRMSGTVSDIDERKRAGARFRTLVELAPEGLVVSSDGVIEYANPAAVRLLGAGCGDALAGRCLDELTAPEGMPLELDMASTAFSEGGRRLVLTRLRDASAERRFRDAAEASGEYVWEADAAWRYTYLSERVETVLGYSRAELLGRRPHELMPLGEDRAFDARLSAQAPQGEAFRNLVHRSLAKAGNVVWQSVSGVPVRDAAGRLIGYRGTAADVTPRMQAEARAEYLATRDALTGLPNRVLLMDRGAQAILAAARSRTQLALLSIDLDRFKLVNDAYGHAIGDALLRAVAERLEGVMRGETLARIGADEFVLLKAIRNAEEAAGHAQRVLDLLARPFGVEGRSFNVGASIGIGIYPNDGRDFTELLKNANAAMVHAKDSGRGTWRAYAPALQARSLERLRLEAELRGALARGELRLHWQPVLRGRRRMVGAEALVRWQHPERGLLLPDDFVPLAEESGLVRAIGEWTLQRSLAQAGAWQRAHPGRAWYALNVSAAELEQHDVFVERIEAALRAHGLPGACLELEVTERALLASLEENVQTLRRLGSLGVRVAIDDFGTGYSSLAYLRQLPVHKLKIDRSFLRSIDSERADEAIVRAIVTLAKTLDIAIAAEGVENEAQLSRLLALGCEEWQGHYCSVPLEAEGLEMLLASDLLSDLTARKSEA